MITEIKNNDLAEMEQSHIAEKKIFYNLVSFYKSYINVG